MGRRTLLFVAAVLVAAVGTTLVYLYVNGVDKRAAAGQESVDVLVAQTAIPVGMKAGDAEKIAAFNSKKFLVSSVAGIGIVGDLATIRDQVAIAPIPAGTPITKAMFGPAGSEQVLPIPNGDVAVTVQLTDPARVATFVRANSQVAVFVTIATGGAGKECTQLLLPSARVIAAGESTLLSEQNTDSSQAPATGAAALMTLAVDQQDATKLIYAQGHGELYFALLNNKSKIDSSGSTCIDAGNVFD